MSPLRAPLLLAAALAIASAGGCGFHLRGGVSLPEAYAPVYVSGSQDLRGALMTGLRGGGVEVTTDPASAGARLEIRNESFSRRTLSVDPDSGRAQEYEVSYQVRYRLVDGEGRVIADPPPIALQRDYFFDADAVLGTSREVSTLYEEMRRDAAQRILRQVDAAVRAGP
jgi:outer membrane lipopolysaccharide assembly protein LptE/RlpB